MLYFTQRTRRSISHKARGDIFQITHKSFFFTERIAVLFHITHPMPAMGRFASHNARLIARAIVFHIY